MEGNNHGGDSTAIPINDGGGMVEKLSNTIAGKLVGKSPLLASCCIFRVPWVIRRQKEAAYEPNVVSIGPYHRDGSEKFQLMENVKWWYLHGFLSSCSSMDISLESLIEVFMDKELGKRARDSYAEPLHHLSEEDLIEMMILDGCFLLELFRKEYWCTLKDKNDPVFNLSCMLEHLYHDLLLLENQLPWCVLECLYNLTADSPTSSSSSETGASLTQLVLNFFRQSDADELMLKQNFEVPRKKKILHILDLIRFVIVSGFNPMEEHSVKESEPKLTQRIPNATSLSEAGVEFKKSHQNSNTPECIMNIEFKKGVFTIPPLGIDESTGPLFRNLIAFEQCYYGRKHKVTSYAVLMDHLIDSSEDVDFLCDKGILASWLSPEDAAQFFNKLYNDTTVDFYYQGLSQEVNKYYNNGWHKLMEKLRSEYFSTPWAVISFIAAFILLSLTIVQTVYTVHPGLN
ncbi:unnamed protein product [Prunus armeniaca]|uniref:Uncharacterized protein n=1 Tax=Prunus armeniaca TaxID=36596 RepID=A0A6J5WZG9_PRUAR|nr:unnamed protein product [Prunus armeniaca]